MTDFLDLDLDTLQCMPVPSGTRSTTDPTTLITHVEELTEDHFARADVENARRAESGETLGTTMGPSSLQRIRRSHHLMAQYVAAGMPNITVAALCNTTSQRVTWLKSDPAFAELVAHYSVAVDVAIVDFVRDAAALGSDALQELHERLHDNATQFTQSQLMELVKLTADRSGNGPMTKTANLNINVGIGDQMEAARERKRALGQ